LVLFGAIVSSGSHQYSSRADEIVPQPLAGTDGDSGSGGPGNWPRIACVIIGHVTLGRCRTIKRRQAELLARRARAIEPGLFGEWTADSVDIIRSELASGGSHYTTLAAAPLAA
jgi:hypothetical protein